MARPHLVQRPTAAAPQKQVSDIDMLILSYGGCMATKKGKMPAGFAANAARVKAGKKPKAGKAGKK